MKIADIFSEINPSSSQFSGGVLTLNFSEIIAEIQALNTKLGKNLPVLDTIDDNFEKLFHCLLILIKLREIDNDNKGFNIKIATVQVGSGNWNGETKNQRTYPIRFPFSSDSDVYGDSDNVG